MPNTIFNSDKIRYAAIAACLFLSVLMLGFALPHIAATPSAQNGTASENHSGDTVLTTSAAPAKKTPYDLLNAPEEELTEAERKQRFYLQKILTAKENDPVLQLQNQGLATYDPRGSLKTFCNAEALKIDAVTQKGLYAMNDAPYYQCKAVINFYCFRKIPKKSCELRTDGSSCSNAAEVDPDCAPFMAFVEKAYSPEELREQHQKLLGLVKDKYQ